MNFYGTYAVLTLLDLEAETPSQHQKLRSVFGLTEAEAVLAEHLSAGETLKLAAECLDIALETARTQLKAIFQKTGTNRQIDLARLLSKIGKA